MFGTRPDCATGEVLNAKTPRAEAAELLRGSLSAIRPVPDGENLTIELVGELGAIMALVDADSKMPRRQIAGAVAGTMVAGPATNLIYLFSIWAGASKSPDFIALNGYACTRTSHAAISGSGVTGRKVAGRERQRTTRPPPSAGRARP